MRFLSRIGCIETEEQERTRLAQAPEGSLNHYLSTLPVTIDEWPRDLLVELPWQQPRTHQAYRVVVVPIEFREEALPEGVEEEPLPRKRHSSVLTPRRLRIRGLWPAPPGSRRGGALTARRFPQCTCAVYQVTRYAEPVWMVREVGGERRQVGSRSTTRKGALALAVGAVAHEREKAAAAPDRPSRKSGWRIRSPVGVPRCGS